jgi:hypothetical protein
MVDRQKMSSLMNQAETELKALEIAYEQFFLGLEKRSPEGKRKQFSQRLRKLNAFYIPQTDLKFRLQALSSRFNSYSAYWDRIQRLIDEGKYERHTSRLQRSLPKATTSSESKENKKSLPHRLDSLYDQLVSAHENCQLRPPGKEQIARFLAKQEEVIKKHFGDQPVDFFVVTEAGKPKIKENKKK